MCQGVWPQTDSTVVAKVPGTDLACSRESRGQKDRETEAGQGPGK